MRPFVSHQQMQDLDQCTMQRDQMSAFDLMTLVAKSAAEWFVPRLHRLDRIWVLCGPGNNGGDGYCLAKELKASGFDIRVVSVVPPQSPECRRARKRVRAEIVSVENFLPRGSDWVVDAIFGSGGRFDLSQEIVSVLKRTRALALRRVSFDLPTGLHADGRIHPASFEADYTLAVGFPKLAYLASGASRILGLVSYVGPSFAPPKKPSLFWALEESDFWLPPKASNSFKGSHGHLGLIGGSPERPGAVFMAAEAGARIGAGYVSLLWARPSKSLTLRLKQASFLFRRRWSQKDLKAFSALVIGCGQRPPKKFSYRGLRLPLVIDASALSEATASEIRDWKRLKGRAILTPHPGEAAALLGSKTSDIQRDRVGALKRLCDLTGQSVYLKGDHGLLRFGGGRDSDSRIYVNLSANSVFATAGSGDVLAGILGGCLARFPDQFEKMVISALVFQRFLGETHLKSRATMASDQLTWFEQSFRLSQQQESS